MNEMRNGWEKPIGDVPEGWDEVQTMMGDWLVRVWRCESRRFESSMVNIKTQERLTLVLGMPLNLHFACENARYEAMIAIKSKLV